MALVFNGAIITMTFEAWIAFTAATAVLLVIPGPTILLVISYALGQGWRTAFPIAVGVALGDFTAMTLSMLGVGALLATSALVFTTLKWIGPTPCPGCLALPSGSRNVLRWKSGSRLKLPSGVIP